VRSRQPRFLRKVAVLAELRALGLTQAAAAKLLGISKANVSQVKRKMGWAWAATKGGGHRRPAWIEEALRQDYLALGPEAMAARLGYTRGAVIVLACKLGITRGRKGDRGVYSRGFLLTPEIKPVWQDLRKLGLTAAEAKRELQRQGLLPASHQPAVKEKNLP